MTPYTVKVSYRATAKTLVVASKTAPQALLAAAHQCKGGYVRPDRYIVCKAGVVQMTASHEEVVVLQETVAKIRRRIAA